MTKTEKLLGDWSFLWTPFSKKEMALQPLLESSFRNEGSRKRFKEVNRTLFDLIDEHDTPCFLLPKVLDFIEAVNNAQLLDEPYSLSYFEFWLNHFSKASREQNLLIRSKIAGRHLPRNEYQVFFPVGLGKSLFGSHFVAAHLSPDVDTTVSSFWGWLDSFSCRLAEGLHYWSLPKGFSDGHLKGFFQKTVHPSFFTAIPRSNPTLSLTAMDLMTLQGFVKVSLDVHADTITHGEEGDLAVVVVDNQGFYQGEWRSHDAEATRQVVDSFISLLRWFKNTALVRLIETLSQEEVSKQDVSDLLERLFCCRLDECEPVLEMEERTKTNLKEYLKKVLLLPEGLHHSFHDLMNSTNDLFSSVLEPAIQLLKRGALIKSQKACHHKESMKWLEEVVATFEDCLLAIRKRARTLSHLLRVKNEVLGYPTTFVTLKSDVEEMRLKMKGLDHVTVVEREGEALFPIGIIRALDLSKSMLGSASLRDFSNLEETKSASYIDVASIIDHHKTNIKTSSASTLLLADAQSTNTLIAEATLRLNEEFYHVPPSPPESQVYYWVSKERELIEYITQLFAILDDTDLLNKVSKKDIVAVIKLINRMKQLVNVTDQSLLPLPKGFDTQSLVQEAAKRLLHNKELHSIYRKVYQHRESEVEEMLHLASEKKPSSFFSDTKEQNGCCRVGQTKLFASNLPTFQKCHDKLLAFWIEQNEENFSKNNLIDFYLHMLSTIQGEAEVMGKGAHWAHQDELWIWIEKGDLPLQHLVSFLGAFNASEVAATIPLEVEVRGKRAKELLHLVTNNLTKARSIQSTHEKEPHSLLLIRFPAGLINSRKTQITPFLPKLVG